MQPLSHTFGYAALALSCLAKACTGRVQTQDVAACSGVPLPYLRKILHSLAGAGLVVSHRGRDGGIELARPPTEISLWQIAEVVDPSVGEGRCLMGLSACSDESACPLHEFWKAEREVIRERLEGLSLDDVANFGWNPAVLALPPADATPHDEHRERNGADPAPLRSDAQKVSRSGRSRR